jgi:hypothetical protein
MLKRLLSSLASPQRCLSQQVVHRDEKIYVKESARGLHGSIEDVAESAEGQSEIPGERQTTSFRRQKKDNRNGRLLAILREAEEGSRYFGERQP